MREPHDGQLHLGSGHARRHRVDGVRLELEHRVECALVRGRRLAYEHRPFELAVVAIDVSPGSGDQHVALLHAVAAHEAMGHRRRATADEHRRQLVA